MKKFLPVIIIILIAVVAVGGAYAFVNSGSADNNESQPSMGSESDSSSAEELDLGDQEDLTAQKEVSMDIASFEYEKNNIKVTAGTKVTWTNRDSTAHNVMLIDEATAQQVVEAPTEMSEDILSGPLLDEGESYSFTFNEVGSFDYRCAPHPNMVANVTVVE